MAFIKRTSAYNFLFYLLLTSIVASCDPNDDCSTDHQHVRPLYLSVQNVSRILCCFLYYYLCICSYQHPHCCCDGCRLLIYFKFVNKCTASSLPHRKEIARWQLRLHGQQWEYIQMDSSKTSQTVRSDK